MPGRYIRQTRHPPPRLPLDRLRGRHRASCSHPCPGAATAGNILSAGNGTHVVDGVERDQLPSLADEVNRAMSWPVRNWLQRVVKSQGRRDGSSADSETQAAGDIFSPFRETATRSPSRRALTMPSSPEPNSRLADPRVLAWRPDFRHACVGCGAARRSPPSGTVCPSTGAIAWPNCRSLSLAVFALPVRRHQNCLGMLGNSGAKTDHSES